MLDATDIVRLVGDHVALKPKGREYVGLCPFHDDHSPSMNVVPHKQIYHCFSCGAGGNAIDFVINYHRLTFREALEFLAQRAQITLTPFKPQRRTGEHPGDDTPESEVSSDDLYRANAQATAFFRAILQHPEHGYAARELLARRAVSPEMVEQFQLGAAPDRWDGLCLTTANRKEPAAPYIAAGLFKSRETGGQYDAFRNRLMFPIHNQLGRVIAFGARRIDDKDEPKYLNSPDTPLFNKSRTLYGLFQAAQAIRSTRVAIVTEGYMDTIACHQAGVTNTVATLGTALTRDNARILRRLCDTVVLLFDGDEAGQKAAERAVEIFFAEPIDVRIAVLSRVTDAKDPDELLEREGGRAVLDDAIAKAIDPLDLMFERTRSRLRGLGLAARTRTIEEFVARLTELGLSHVDPIRKQAIIRKLAALAEVEWETVAAMLAQRKSRTSAREATGGADATIQATAFTAAEHVVGCILSEPSFMMALGEEHADVLDAGNFESEAMRTVVRVLNDLFVHEEDCSISGVLAALSGSDEDDAASADEARRLATSLYATVRNATGDNPEKLREHWQERLAQAQRDIAYGRGSQGSAPPAAASGEDAWQTRLAALREKQAAVGANPLALPRPAG